MRVVLLARVPGWFPFRGDRLIPRLVEDGHDIAAVIAERTPTLPWIREWLARLGPRMVLGKILRRGLGLAGIGGGTRRAEVSPPVHVVASHNSPACVELCRSLQPDLIILRGCGIIRKPLLDAARIGVINGHYAELPRYRGVDVTEWAALHGDPIAVSVHFVSEGVDSGAILDSRRVPVERGDTVELLREKSASVAADLFLAVLRALETGAAKPRPQGAAEGRQYFRMHPRLRRLANERLKRIP